MQHSKRAFLYTLDIFPQKDGAGTPILAYSNARAYLDLGYETELVHIQSGPRTREYEANLDGLRIVSIDGRMERPSPVQHAAYVAGFPQRAACGFYYKGHAALRRAVAEREQRSPGAIHHFETLKTAHVATCIDGIKSVWSCHDIESDFARHEIEIDKTVEKRSAHAWEQRKLAFLRKVERATARKSKLVLCISRNDADTMRGLWGCGNAEVLPMSMPEEALAPRTRPWLADGTFEVLHLGQIHHVPTFHSLMFLFEHVLPRLSPDLARRIRLNIVGPIIGGSRCARLQEVGARFPQVKFFGRVPDLRPVYASSDLQIVASTAATGLRTRIIESFAAGLPVLSTSVAAQGIEGLRDRENIVLANTAETFLRELERLGRDASSLENLARRGQQLYFEHYGRKLVAGRLEHLLDQYFGRPRLAS